MNRAGGRMQGAWDRAGAWAHAVHGTRGLTLAGAVLLGLAILEPVLPVGPVLLVAPAVALLAIGLATLPREGVAAQWRARALLGDRDAEKKALRRLVWPLLLCVFLLPKVFLALYGVPHMSPLAGLVLPSVERRVALTALLGILLVAILYLRSSRMYAPDIQPRRPKDLTREDGSHAARAALLWMLAGVVAAWAWLTAPFWQPFSLLDWPPNLASLRSGARGVAGIAFATIVPATLFMVLVAHLGLLRDLVQHGLWRTRPGLTVLAGLHAAGCIAAVCLHAYGLLWIVRYRSLAAF